MAHGAFVSGLKSTPSVYITNQGGGEGDGKISMRGFDPSQTTVLINNISVNDMETGWVYWSNWSNLSDITNSVQVQSGMAGQNMELNALGGVISIQTLQDHQTSFSDFKTVLGNDYTNQINILHHVYNPVTKQLSCKLAEMPQMDRSLEPKRWRTLIISIFLKNIPTISFSFHFSEHLNGINSAQTTRIIWHLWAIICNMEQITIIISAFSRETLSPGQRIIFTKI